MHVGMGEVGLLRSRAQEAGSGAGGVGARGVGKKEDVRVFPGLVVVVAGLLAAVQGVEGGLGRPLMGYTVESPHWILKCSSGGAPLAIG